MSDIVSQLKRLCTTTNCDDDRKRSDSDPMTTCAINRLNDFALLQIFNQLDITDLCSAADVNQQFKRVSKMSFAGRYATFFYMQHLKRFISHSTVSFAAQMRRTLCKFGDVIESMTLKDFDGSWKKFYPIESEAISRYCAGTMDELNFELRDNLKCDDWSRPLISSLRTLTIQCTGLVGDVGLFFSECHNLNTLRLLNVPYTSEVAQTYCKLEELYVDDYAMLTAKTTAALLQMNPQIKRLHMPDHNANETIYAVAPIMYRLEKLVLRNIRKRDDYYENVTELARLKSLRQFELHNVAPDFVAAIEAMENISIDQLKWFECPSDLHFMRQIYKLKTLKILTLTGISLPFDDCLRRLGEQLPSLSELELGFKHQVDPIFSIGCLIKFVQRSTNLNALIIRTIQSKLFNQQFYDQLLGVIDSRERSTSNSRKTFKLTIYCRGVTSLQMQSNSFQIKFIEGEYCSCSHCDPNSIVWCSSFDVYDFEDGTE